MTLLELLLISYFSSAEGAASLMKTQQELGSHSGENSIVLWLLLGVVSILAYFYYGSKKRKKIKNTRSYY